MLFLQLSGENLKVAKAEVEGFIGKKVKVVGNLAILRATKTNFSRLAYCKAVYRFVFDCEIRQLLKRLEHYKWSSIYRKDFCLRIHGKSDFREAELAGFIWRGVRNPRVNLDKPTTRIDIFFIGSRAYAGLFLFEIEHDFEGRKAHLRPKMFP
ncbi:MAG: hypothetical protein V1837_06330, partial [Candidatus Woesearchaeota archaeon]